MPTFDEDRARLKELNKSYPLTQEQREEKWAVQGRLREQGFYGKRQRGPEREDSEAEWMIQSSLDRF